MFREKRLPDEVPSFELVWEKDEMWVPKIMKMAGLASSTSGALRLITQGGVLIDDKRYTDPDGKLEKGSYLFKVGKRKFLRVNSK